MDNKSVDSLVVDGCEFEIVNPERHSSKRQDSLTNFDDIAHILLQEKFILTALEFHTELLENGLELPRLRDFFSNPGNFERPVDVKSETIPGLPRTSSIQTFDSLDFARYSDDGDRQTNDKLAVLEFELRKAQDMIKSLRANLTEAAEPEGTVDNYHEYVEDDDSIKLHERRALDYLVNEYLLKNNYKLTSITFSDENSNQDFEDWDDVGLNIPKPPSLLFLYREFGRNSKTMANQTDIGIQAEVETRDDFSMTDDYVFTEQLINFCNSCGEIVLDTKLSSTSLADSAGRDTPVAPSESSDDLRLEQSIIVLQSPGSSNSVHLGGVPDTFPVELNISHLDKTENRKIAQEPIAAEQKYVLDNLSPFHKLLNELIINRSINTDDRLQFEVSKAVDSNEDVISLLARCLPHIVPNVILSKREELLPVILCAISLHPDAAERDKLLNLLFNLIKRPDETQRQMILSGFITIAQLMGTTKVESEVLPQCWEQISHKYPERRILVAEACGVLIPYVTTDIKSSLVLSMLQQMLLEEKIEVVRNATVHSLAILMASMEDGTKFSVGKSLLLSALKDPSELVYKSSLRLLLPAFCFWSTNLNFLHTQLVPEIIQQINSVTDRNTVDDNQSNLIHLIDAFIAIVPWVFVLVIETSPFSGNALSSSASDIDVVDRLPPFVSPLCNLGLIVGDILKCNSLIKNYEMYTSAEWYESWSTLDWVVKSVLPDLFNLLRKDRFYSQEESRALCQLFFWFNRMFGRHFTIKYVKPCFRNMLKFNDQDGASKSSRSTNIQILIPVYACGVLTVFPEEEDRKELVQFLREVLITLSTCRLPLISMELVIKDLRSSVGYDDLILSVLWDGVVHSSPLVRASSAILFQTMIGGADEHVLATKIVPALVTLANDSEIAVKISTVPTFGCIIEKSTSKELLAKTEMQFQTFLDDPMYKDQFELRKEIIKTLGQIAPISDVRFREEFVLPHLVALANCNNQLQHETKRIEIALVILDVFNALSGFCTNEKVIHDLVIPGLKCILTDIQELAPSQEELVYSLISEFNSKIPASSSTVERQSSVVTAVVSSSVDEVKSRVSKIFTNRPVGKPNIQNIFSSRKSNP